MQEGPPWSMRVVTPECTPHMSASRPKRPVTYSNTWACVSMRPGSTSLPDTSTVSLALEGAIEGNTAAMRPYFTATSKLPFRFWAGSMTRPPRNIRSWSMVGILALKKRLRAVPFCETKQGLPHALADRQHLEQFPHLRGREQLLDRGGCRQVSLGVFRILRRKQVGDAAVDEELGLAGVSEHLEFAFDCGTRERAEVHVRSDVLQPRQVERIAVHVMTVVAGEGAGRALRMEIFARRETVVDGEDRAALEEAAERTHPGAREQCDFAFVAAGRWNVHHDVFCD